MTHLLDDPHNGQVHVRPTFSDAHFKTVLRMPREHTRRRPARPSRSRYPQAVRVQMVDTISPALVLGCAVVAACFLAMLVFVVVQLAQRALDLVHRFLGIGGPA